MSLQFLTRPPYADTTKLKDAARKAAEINDTYLAVELDKVAHSLAGCSWLHLLRDHGATLEGGDVYLTVDQIPVKITSTFKDKNSKPVAVGSQLFLRIYMGLSCGVGGDDVIPTPGLLLSYGPGPKDGNVTLDIAHPTLRDGKVLSSWFYGSDTISLQERLGPISQTIRDWVSATHREPISEILDIAEASVPRLVEMEAIRMSHEVDAELSASFMEAAHRCCSPAQRSLLGKWMARETPMFAAAYLMIAEDVSLDIADRISAMRRGVEVERQNIDYRLNPGDIFWWRDLNTQTYMKAARTLADLYAEAGLPDVAISMLANLMGLNPSDNQSNRYPLLALYLLRRKDGDHQSAHAVLADYLGTRDAILLYAGALLAFQENGDTQNNRDLLDLALAANAFVAPQLHDMVAQKIPKGYADGSAQEAIVFLSFFRGAFVSTPGAVNWISSATPIEQ